MKIEMCLPGLLRQWSVVQNARPLARAPLEGKPDQRTETRGPEGAQAHEIHTTRSNENSPSLGSGGDPEVGSFLLIRQLASHSLVAAASSYQSSNSMLA